MKTSRVLPFLLAVAIAPVVATTTARAADLQPAAASELRAEAVVAASLGVASKMDHAPMQGRSPLPEPDAWCFLISGFALMGGLQRFRRGARIRSELVAAKA